MAESREFESDYDYEQELNEYYEETYGNSGQDEEMELHESKNEFDLHPAADFSTLRPYKLDPPAREAGSANQPSHPTDDPEYRADVSEWWQRPQVQSIKDIVDVDTDCRAADGSWHHRKMS